VAPVVVTLANDRAWRVRWSLCHQLKDLFPALYQDNTNPPSSSSSSSSVTNTAVIPSPLILSLTNVFENLLNDENINESVNTPASNNILFVNELEDILCEEEQNKIRSITYKLMYLATRTRPDIYFAVNHLCTKINKYTLDDKRKVNRVLKYLHGTVDMGINFIKKDQLNIELYADASHGIHQDGKGHSGLSIMINNSPILVKSSKQKIVSLSSTESELICLSDSIIYLIGLKNFINNLGFNVNNIKVYQDNLSTIQLIQHNNPRSQRTKHINIRYFAIKEKLNENNLQLSHKKSTEMLADILTKPLQGNIFKIFSKRLLNYEMNCS
jgi:hypothetical protein